MGEKIKYIEVEKINLPATLISWLILSIPIINLFFLDFVLRGSGWDDGIILFDKKKYYIKNEKKTK